MSNIEKYSSKLPSIFNLGLMNSLLEQVPSEYYTVELIISLSDTNVNVKELSSYLDFIYIIDGHLSEIGYARYVHNPEAQIKIDRVRFGSLEIVLERFLKSVDAEKLEIIFLTLKFLPDFVKTLTDGVKSYYEIRNTREDYLEKRDKRKNRKEIRELISQEQSLLALDKKDKEKLVTIIEELFNSAGRRLNPASRLAQKSVKSIKIKPITRKKED